jgi:hypothetical protein
MVTIQSAEFVTPDRKVVKVVVDGKAYFVNREPNDGTDDNHELRLLKRWVAEGNKVAPYVAPPVPEPIDEADVDNVPQQLRAFAMVLANVTGTPMAEIRQKYRTAMNVILDQQG